MPKPSPSRLTLGKVREQVLANLHDAGLKGCTISQFKPTPKKRDTRRQLTDEVLARAIEERQVFEIRFGSNRKWIHRDALAAWLAKPAEATPPPTPRLSPESVRQAYDALVAESGFRDVKILDLAWKGGFPVEPLKETLERMHQEGSVVLGRGDSSLASESERQAGIEWQGALHLRVRLQ